MYTVIKSNNKAWLKEDASIPRPEFSALEMLSPAVDTYTPIKEYENHLASRKEIPIALEYVDYWAEGAKIEEREFFVMEWHSERHLNTEVGFMKYEPIAIPAQDEAGTKDASEFFKDDLKVALDRYLRDYGAANKIIDDAVDYMFPELKSKYEIKRKQ